MATAVAEGGTIKGTVKASGVPLPGVAITATSTDTSKKYATSTDVDGNYQMAIPANGHYLVKTDLAGFESITQEVVINASSENVLPVQTADFTVDLASRAAPVVAKAVAPVPGGTVSPRPSTANSTAPTPPGTRTGFGPGGNRGGAVARVGRGTQQLAVQNGDGSDATDATAGEGATGAQLPSLGGLGGDDAIGSAASSDAVAVSGQQGQINGLAGFSEDDLRNRIQDMRSQGLTNGDIAGAFQGAMQGQGFGGPGGGFGGDGGGFGGPGGQGFGGTGFAGGGPGGGGPGGGGGRGGGGGGGRGGGGGGGGFGGGFGGFRGQNPNAWHGTIGYTGANSALNADSYSVTGTPIPKPQSDRNSLVASFTGTPYIPHLLAPNPKQFLFLSISETRNSSPSTIQALVPTLAQRYGDLTPSQQAGYVAGKTVIGNVYDPTKPGTVYGNTACYSQLATVDPSPTACITGSELNPAALALLNYYPLPNVTATQTQYNYQANFPGTSHSSQVSARFNRSFGAAPTRGRGFGGGGGAGGGRGNRNANAPKVLRQSIAENFAYSHSANANQSFSPLLGGSSESDGYSFTSSYTVGYGRINSSASLGWNRSRSTGSNYFTNRAVNPAVSNGIYVGTPTVYGNPFYFGVPSVNISGGLQGLSDTTPSNSVNQTISFTDFVSWTHKKHNMRYGSDFHRIHADSIGGTNVLGSFTFSGFSTENPALQTCNSQTDAGKCDEYGASGLPIADLLLGLPQQTGITAGLNKIYLRGNSWDWYVQDDWRAKANFTVSYGLRWEYFSPYSEKYDRLVNLNLSGSGTGLQISTVCGAAAPAGSVSTACAAVSPGTLVKPDKALYSPRVSIAWSPRFKFAKNTVVRSGYGINYNTGAYSRFAQKMAFQQPFAITQTNTLSSGANPTTGCVLPSQLATAPAGSKAMTLANGFNCSQQVTQSNFGVDPNYRLGLVQVYNLGIQRTLPQGVVLNIDYTGAYAFNQDMVRAPNRTPSGLLNQTAGQFTYEDSLGYLRSNALAVNARERMHKGVSLQGTYTYSHSIDDASSVGGSGGSIAQNDQNLGAEESNSSFDRRHVLNGTFIIEPPFGPNRAFLNKGGVWAQIFDGYSISGNFTFASGSYASPSYALTSAEVAAGAAGSLRPNRVPGQPIRGAGSHLQWFNTAAFAGLCSAVVAPATPSPYCLADGAYGNASRNSIELPGQVGLSGSLSRTVSFGETRSFEARITANNALNTVQYSGVSTQINSQNYGQVTSAAGMRSFTYTARFRF
jgi:trimeric autotransporter adhesin